MPNWQNSDRRSRLPADWPKIRSRILKRDKRECQVVMEDGTLCLEYANEVDHEKAGDDHSDHNLRAICWWHHKLKSSQEGGLARAKRMSQVKKSFSRVEKHPGVL